MANSFCENWQVQRNPRLANPNLKWCGLRLLIKGWGSLRIFYRTLQKWLYIWGNDSCKFLETINVANYGLADEGEPWVSVEFLRASYFSEGIG